MYPMSDIIKPVVHYKKFDNVYNNDIRVGQHAFVCPTDHPRCSNTGPVLTSVVERYDPETGAFETENTRYVLCPVA